MNAGVSSVPVGVLVLAGTPLGRSLDASPALVQALRTADAIAAEDTRRLHRLATELDVRLSVPVISFYESVEQARIPGLVDRVRRGERVVVVTDAGMPSVSDPGYRLVAAVVAAGLPVTCVPGPSAVLTALALSGLPPDRFCFEGFLPRKSGARSTALKELAAERRTMVFFESVHRLTDTLAAMVDVFGADRPAALCRELTKTYEEVRRGSLGSLAAGAADVKGEVTLVVAGAAPVAADVSVLGAEVAALVAAGSSRKDAAEAVAARHGVARRAVYESSLHPSSLHPSSLPESSLPLSSMPLEET